MLNRVWYQIQNVLRPSRLLIVFLSCLCLLVQTVWAQAPDDSNSYPYKNPLVATLTSVWINSQDLNFQEGELTLHPERSTLKLVGQRNRLKYTYALQSNSSAPLIFIISGLGGHSLSGTSLFLAEQAYKIGYSVVTLPSSTHWSFALAASKSGRVGYLPQDAEDQLQVLSLIRQQLQKMYSIRPLSFSLLGFSYGALDSAFIASEDLKQGEFQFKKILLINPPINRDYAMKKLDSYYTQGLKWSERQRNSILSLAFGQFTTATPLLVREVFSGDSSNWLSSLADSQLAWLIGNEFRKSLRDVVYVSQEVLDDGILKSHADEFHQSTRLDEAKDINFERYLNSVVFQFVKNGLQKNNIDLERDCLLMKAVNEVVSKSKWDQRFFLFHNQDDFLLNPHQIDELKKFPGTVTLYPGGGHLGNLWFSKNIEDIRSALLF